MEHVREENTKHGNTECLTKPIVESSPWWWIRHLLQRGSLEWELVTYIHSNKEVGLISYLRNLSNIDWICLVSVKYVGTGSGEWRPWGLLTSVGKKILYSCNDKKTHQWCWTGFRETNNKCPGWVESSLGIGSSQPMYRQRSFRFMHQPRKQMTLKRSSMMCNRPWMMEYWDMISILDTWMPSSAVTARVLKTSLALSHHLNACQIMVNGCCRFAHITTFA